jgi:hypothetical protein
MFNFVRSLYAAQYGFRVTLNLGPAIELSEGSRFPNFAPLVRRSRISGLSAKETAKLFQLIAKGVDSKAVEGLSRDIAINEGMSEMEANTALWEGRL